MIIKELHIRNIASIEKADINFEKDLIPLNESKPAALFLISGDTGAGKSVILDSISMALYKTTPRINSVVNIQQNEYTCAEGESIRLVDIKQYTRLGISEKDECYSEVVFEGNDGKTYHARLKLGMSLKRTDKATGRRVLKYSSPKWEIKIGSEDWTADNVESTILNAVGLTFKQFGRMAMLAQGQFANFLTGDKKEREAILEQLTNTQHFSAYGDAITSLFNKAGAEKDRIQTQYDTDKQHTLSEDTLEQLTAEQTECQKQQQAADKKITDCTDKLTQVAAVLSSEETANTHRARQQELAGIIAGEKYRSAQALFTDWDSTDSQRHLLKELQDAKKKADNARTRLNSRQDIFRQLSADLAYRQAEAADLNDTIRKHEDWLKAHQLHADLFAKAGEVCRLTKQYGDETAQADGLSAQLQSERAQTGSLKTAVQDAIDKAQAAEKAAGAKEAEIETKRRQREALNPSAVNEQLDKQEKAKHALEELRSESDALQNGLQEAEQLRAELQNDEEILKKYRDDRDSKENIYRDKKSKADEADKRLTTMKMSLDEKIIELRHRLHDEHTEVCPLCGQHIAPDSLRDDFEKVLTPLRAEQQQAAEELERADKQRQDSITAHSNFAGSFNRKKEQLAEAERKNAAAEQKIKTKAALAGLNGAEPLTAQIERSLLSLETDIGELKNSQREAELLQKEIDKLSDEKKPLDHAKQTTEMAKIKAENAFKINVETISRLEGEHKEKQRKCEGLQTEITSLLNGYCDNWLNGTDAMLIRLKADADEYNEHQKQHRNAETQHKNAAMLIDVLSGYSQNLLKDCPEWKPADEASAYSCVNISNEWNLLQREVTGQLSILNDSKNIIDRSTAQLDVYYRETGKTEQMLQELIDQDSRGLIAAAREFVNETNAQFKSHSDAIAAAETNIVTVLKNLGITDRAELPDKQQLEEELAVTQSVRDDIIKKIGEISNLLNTHDENIKKLQATETLLQIAKQKFERWERLNKYFGGTRFRHLVQTYILRPLLNNANIYLEKITDRYRLTCSEDNEQLSIFVLDRYNKNQVRSATILSGGERFMISLALSLALSELNRPDMNVNILFIDEGFGTLDEKSLESVMDTLQRLQEIAGQSNRRVGIISHRRELDERIPIKIKVTKKGEGRSLIKITRSSEEEKS